MGSWLATLVVVLSVIGNHAAAAYLPASGELRTVWLLPEHPSKEFPAGEYIPILLGVHNQDSKTFNFSRIMGSLNLPQEFNYYVQNFSANAYSVSLKNEEESTLEYKFRPDKSLSPMELQVALTVFYKDNSGKEYSTTFFNETIDIVETYKTIDYEAIMMVVVMFGILGGIGYGVLAWMGSLNVIKKVAVGGKKKGAKEESSNDDWAEGTPAAKKLKEQKSGDKKSS